MPAAASALRDARVARLVGVCEIDAREAVDLEIDEPRDGDPAPRPGEPDAVDPVVHDLDVAPQELAVDDRGPDAEPHRLLSDLKTAKAGFLCQAVSTSPERQ